MQPWTTCAWCRVAITGPAKVHTNGTVHYFHHDTNCYLLWRRHMLKTELALIEHYLRRKK